MVESVETHLHGYGTIASIEQGDQVDLIGMPPARTLVSIVAETLHVAILSADDRLSLRTPYNKLDGALDSFAARVSRLSESDRNRVGRQIYRSVEFVREHLPERESLSLQEVSSKWFEKAFPGRLARWEKETPQLGLPKP